MDAKKKNLEEFSDDIKKEINNIDIENINIQQARGFNLYYEKRYDEAIIVFNKIIEVDSKNDYAWYHKGRCLESLGKYDEAIKAYETAIDIDPGSPAWSNILNLDRLGKCKSKKFKDPRYKEIYQDMEKGEILAICPLIKIIEKKNKDNNDNKDNVATELLIRALKFSSYKDDAAKVFGITKDPKAIKGLVEALNITWDIEGKIWPSWEIAKALIKIGKPAVDLLIPVLKRTDHMGVQITIIKIFGEIKDKRTQDTLMEFQEHKNKFVQEEAKKALKRFNKKMAKKEELKLKNIKKIKLK